MSEQAWLRGIRSGVTAMTHAMVTTRRDLHEHAELSTQEFRTQRVIIERLQALAIEDVSPTPV
jgi:metal-dependent amidase/aminoacylase/carboxypeptidase family protein